MKLKQNKFLTSTILLIFSGMATKILGLIIKVIFTRIVGTTTISLYTLVMPTYSLLLTISTLAMPTTIAKLIAEKNDTRVLNNALIIIVVLNALLIIGMFFLSPFIANNLLKEPDAYYLLIAMSLTLPFASIACILKGYYYGKQKMLPHVISNTVEQIIRLIIVITIIPLLIQKSYVHAATGLILTSLATEFASVVVFLSFMKKHDVINFTKINFNKQNTKDILDLSIPSVMSKIVGNICYFFEPIILTNILLYKGFSNSYIITQYGAYNAYAISTLTIPSFFVSAISLALVPEATKFLAQKNYPTLKKRLKQAFIFTFIIGLSSSFFVFIFRDVLLMLLYNTTLGSDFIRILAPFFILFYFESVFASFMQSIGKTNITFKITIIASIIKLITLALFSFLNLGIYALLISEIINIIFVVCSNYLYLKSYLDKLN